MSSYCSNFFRYIFCCECRKKTTFLQNNNQDENIELLYNNLSDPLLRKSHLDIAAANKKIKTSVLYTKPSCLKEINIKGNDFITDKSQNPSEFYDKLADLGEGSFGKIFKVRHKMSESIRALKMIDGYELDKEKVLREFEVLKTLSHPNIIKIYDVYYYNSCLYLIEEYIGGGDLFSKVIKLKSLSENMSLSIMKQIFSAVYYLHTNNIVHGDLKLENIMVESLIQRKATLILSDDNAKDQIDIKLIDFGCSMIFQNTPLTELIGTVYYLAPEVIEGKYSLKCDIWSCGVILYILISGKFPFDGNSDEEIFTKIKSGKFSFDKEFDNISLETKDLIKLCLEVSQDNRISAEEALAHEAFERINSNFSLKRKMIRNSKSITDNDISNAITNIKDINNKLVFQKTVIKYITYNLMSSNSKEISKIRNFYKLFDENNDGCLTSEELFDGFKKLGYIINQKELDGYMNALDPQGSGVILYEDFITLFIDKNKLLEEKNLKNAFDMFDIDKSGLISIDEIKNVFMVNNKLNEHLTEEIVKQLNLENKSEITFEDFKHIMNNAY